MGAVVFAVMGLYLLISIGVVKAAIAYARKNGKRTWLYGLSAALVMYLIPFWDWIPTIAMHRYYCATEAGFWVYKTPEQWVKENPGVIETLVPNKDAPSRRLGDMTNYADSYHLNSRIDWIVKHNGKHFPNRWRHEQELVDVNAKEILARYIDFSTDQEQPQAGYAGWKFWLDNRHCNDGESNLNAMREFKNPFRGVQQ